MTLEEKMDRLLAVLCDEASDMGMSDDGCDALWALSKDSAPRARTEREKLVADLDEVTHELQVARDNVAALEAERDRLIARVDAPETKT